MKRAQLSVVEKMPVALQDLNVPQLTEAAKMLDECQARYDKLSGICGTMRGLVFIDLKRKVAHGKFLPLLTHHFKKTKKTSAQDMRLAREFAKSNPKVTFQLLGQDLASTILEIEKAQIDLKHPLIKEISKWVGPRTRYQLLLDFPGERGGDNTPRDADGKRIADRRRTKAEIEREEFEEEALGACKDAAKTLRELLTVTGPEEECAWDILSASDLDKLKQDLYDAHLGVKSSLERKRKAARK